MNLLQARFAEVLRMGFASLEHLEHFRGFPAARNVPTELVECFLAAELTNCVVCEGLERSVRCESLAKWRDRVRRMGLVERPFDPADLNFLARDALRRGMTMENVGGFASVRMKGSPLVFGAAWESMRHSSSGAWTQRGQVSRFM